MPGHRSACRRRDTLPLLKQTSQDRADGDLRIYLDRLCRAEIHFGSYPYVDSGEVIESMSKLREDHYLPAAFLGGFGEASGSGRGRNAKIAVRFRSSPDVVKIMKPDDLAKQPGIYRLASPPKGMSPDAIDRLWRSYEPKLPAAIKAAERSDYTERDWAVIGLHLAAQGVRHPDFIQLAREYLADQGAPESDIDLPQLHRIKTMEDGFEQLAQTSELAFVVSGPSGSKFVINDKGYMKLEDSHTRQRGIFFPLSSTLALLAVMDCKTSGNWNDARPDRRLALTPQGIRMLNEIAWRQGGVEFVAGHPDEASPIARLDDSRQLIEPSLGPYRGTAGGFFDWVST
jgi:hypothetical protein